jgi:hypothetical protein
MLLSVPAFDDFNACYSVAYPPQADATISYQMLPPWRSIVLLQSPEVECISKDKANERY